MCSLWRGPGVTNLLVAAHSNIRPFGVYTEKAKPKV